MPNLVTQMCTSFEEEKTLNNTAWKNKEFAVYPTLILYNSYYGIYKS